MSNKIEQMLRKTEELLKASRNVRANREGLSSDTAYGRLKGYHEKQGKQYNIDPYEDTGIPPELSNSDVYTGYGSFHPAHEIAHAQAMSFPQEKDSRKPSWKGKTLADWQLYIDNNKEEYEHKDPYVLADDEEVAVQTSALHSRRAGVGLREDVSSTPELDSTSLYGDTPNRTWNDRKRQMQGSSDELPNSTLAIGRERVRNRVRAIQKVAQLRQKLIDLNIFQMKGGQWEKQTGPNARINERQFRQEHPQESEQLLGKPTIPQLRKK